MSGSNNFYWRSVGTSSTGAIIQQRQKLIGGDTLVPTRAHRKIDQDGEVLDTFQTPYEP